MLFLWTVSLITLLVLWALLWFPRPLPDVSATTRPLLIGHRGLRGRLPENSLAAFTAAFEAGLDGVEFDVQRSRDGRLFIYHDVDLPDGRSARSLTLAELQAFDGDIPALDDLFALARGYPGKLLNLEIKSQSLRSDGLEKEVVRAVLESGLAGRVLLSSFNPLSLLRVRLLAPELRTALLYAPDLPLLLRSGYLARWLHVDALHPHHSQVDARMLRWAARHRLPVNTWTVNDRERVKDLTRLGVNGLMADDPEALKDEVLSVKRSGDAGVDARRIDERG